MHVTVAEMKHCHIMSAALLVVEQTDITTLGRKIEVEGADHEKLPKM